MDGLSRDAQVVLQVRIADVPAKHRTGQIGAVRVPEQQIERRRRLALEVAVDDVLPHQIVGAERRERERKLLTLHDAALADRGFARGHALLRHQRSDFAGIREVEHRGQQGHA